MDKYTYLLLDFVFFAPVYLYLFLNYRALIKQYRRLLWLAALGGAVVFFTADLYSIHINAWYFSHSKTLGIFLDKAPIEELLWPILAAVMSAIITVVLADEEDKNRALKK